MAINATLLSYLNGIAVASTATVPVDQDTLALVQQVAFDLSSLPASYLTAGTSATQVLLVPNYPAGAEVVGGSPQMLNTFDTVTATVKQTSIPPKLLGV